MANRNGPLNEIEFSEFVQKLEAFAQAMGKLWSAHPDDLDAGTFYAEAMMDTQPWDYWQGDGVTPKGHAPEIVATLESIIGREANLGYRSRWPANGRAKQGGGCRCETGNGRGVTY